MESWRLFIINKRINYCHASQLRPRGRKSAKKKKEIPTIFVHRLPLGGFPVKNSGAVYLPQLHGGTKKRKTSIMPQFYDANGQTRSNWGWGTVGGWTLYAILIFSGLRLANISCLLQQFGGGDPSWSVVGARKSLGHFSWFAGMSEILYGRWFDFSCLALFLLGERILFWKSKGGRKW